MTTGGAQGRQLDILVTGWRYESAIGQGHRLYAAVRYGNYSINTKTYKGGTTSASFNDNLRFQFIEDLHEFDIAVWRKSRLGKVRKDKLIAFRKIDLEQHILGGCRSRKMWQLHYQPKHGADIRNAGQIYLEINCPLVQPQNVPPLPSAPYGYPYG